MKFKEQYLNEKQYSNIVLSILVKIYNLFNTKKLFCILSALIIFVVAIKYLTLPKLRFKRVNNRVTIPFTIDKVNIDR